MPVLLSPSAPESVGPLTQLAQQPVSSVPEALQLAERLAAALPATPDSADLWQSLATLAARDLAWARAVEPHLDAAGILTQAGVTDIWGTWGVFAAEGGEPLRADPANGTFTLSGTKQWCSLAGSLDAALITATLADGSRGLFAVELRHPGVHVDTAAWVARGLTEIPSGPVTFDTVPARAVGEPGWYLERPGFAWGGIAVAACWYGGAIGIARTVHARAAATSDPFVRAHLGAIDLVLQSARRALAEAAVLADAGSPLGHVTAKRVRGTVARACEEVIWRAGHALGPAPLALDDAHAKRVVDLQLYIRQHHAERDDASLGDVLAETDAPW